MNYIQLFSAIYGLSSALLFLFVRLFKLPAMKKRIQALKISQIEQKFIQVIEIFSFYLLLSSFLIQLIGSFNIRVKYGLIDLFIILINNGVIWFLFLGEYFKIDAKPSKKKKWIFDIGNIYIQGLGAKIIIYWVIGSCVFWLANLGSPNFFDSIVSWNILISSIFLTWIWKVLH